MAKPRGEVSRFSNRRVPDVVVTEPQFQIAAWCPDPEGKLPAEQVHFVVTLPAALDLNPMVIRFKSPDSLGFFIEELTRYRREVWPDAEALGLMDADANGLVGLGAGEVK